MIGAILFILGLALGSFIHVLASRYDPERSLLTRDTLGGRSHCTNCKKILAWYELIPVASFLIQRGTCRSCGARLGWSYVWVELASGFIVAFVPWQVAAMAASYSPHVLALAALWTSAFLILLLMALIDIRLQIIPDGLTITLAIIGLAVTALAPQGQSWIYQFGIAIAAAIGAALFFGLLIAITRGRGMGMGDMKLAFALGLLFSWPEILPLVMLAFVIGAVVGVALIARGSKKMKSAVPFGPFLALAAAAVFFFWQPLLGAYLRFFNI
jgi:prepilin signal peptidase PulO-like enzyme (type II secretory pathway)